MSKQLKTWTKPVLRKIAAGSAEANPTGQNGDGAGGQKRS